jgi:hypothetical protein
MAGFDTGERVCVYVIDSTVMFGLGGQEPVLRFVTTWLDSEAA